MDKKFAQNQMDKKCVHQVVILVAPGFDEESVIHCLCQMRQRGTAVALVGVPSNLVIGASGLNIHPDFSLTHLNQTTFVDNRFMLIIPGGVACINTLLSDPRVHQIIKQVSEQGGKVATMSPLVPEILMNLGLLNTLITSRLFVQGSIRTSDFVRLLVAHTV